MTLAADETDELRQTLMQRVPRSVVLVPNDRTKNEVVQEARSLGITTFDAAAIEESKAEFVTATGAAAVFANRYDGIDFPGDECRLLFLDGLPRTTNPQERFFVAKMGANALLQGRMQTRVVQAVGRCTRSLQDYSAVVVTGSELTDYLNSPVRLSFLHPELQAELDFGARQSTNVSITNLVENFDIFLRNDAAWEGVNRQILAKRDAASQATPSGVGQLQAVVTFLREDLRRRRILTCGRAGSVRHGRKLVRESGCLAGMKTQNDDQVRSAVNPRCWRSFASTHLSSTFANCRRTISNFTPTPLKIFPKNRFPCSHLRISGHLFYR
jgi:hypothetical protein